MTLAVLKNKQGDPSDEPVRDMAIPDYVKMQAMNAVSHRETTQMMRAYKDNGVFVSPETLFSHSEPPRPEIRPLTEEAKRQAMSAVSHPETLAQIRMLRDNGEINAPHTPSHLTNEIAEKIARMRKAELDMHLMHKTITKDGFGREYG